MDVTTQECNITESYSLLDSTSSAYLRSASTRWPSYTTRFYVVLLTATLSTIVREFYMHLFAEHDYLTDWGKQIGATTPPPIVGDLEPERH